MKPSDRMLRPMGREPADLPAMLRERARLDPDRRAFTFLAEGEQELDCSTYAELDRRARALATALGALCERGDRALLLCPPGLDFVAAFFGCLYAGVVAVPAYPPRSPRALPRLRAILADAQPAVVLAPAALASRIAGWFAREPDLPSVPWLATDAANAVAHNAPEQAEAWQDPGLRGDELAFLQYTSGSTATPKGVMVSHANLAHNQGVIERACRHDADSVFVSWLPVYHDLGLIGQVLQGVWTGAHCVLMAPVAFLQHPLRWLEAVTRYRATTSGGPNFAYELCLRRIRPEDRERLDLSSWRVAFNGAEPVRADTLARFTAAFAPAGFRAAAHYPCYGLAEATLMVSGGTPDEPPAVRAWDPAALSQGRAEPDSGGRALAGSGRALSDLEVVIADPASGALCPPGAVGEIWVAGGSVAKGYWNRPEETEETFAARLANGRGPFLRTGDLGFLDGSELVVTGRIKDLIILRGRNLYPQDIELAAERSHPALRPGGGAAFAVDAGGEERLVVVHEVERHTADRAGAVEEIAAAVRHGVAQELEAPVHELVLVPAGGVPRTTSGKVQRRPCRDLYLRGELTVVGRSALDADAVDLPAPEGDALPEALAATPQVERPALVEAWLRLAFARLARTAADRIDPDLPLTAQGLDSLVAVELRNAAEAELGMDLPLVDLLEGMTLREAAGRSLTSLGSSDLQDAGEAGGLDDETAIPLSFGQRALWFLHRLAPRSAAYNIAAAARLLSGPRPGELRLAVQALADRHSVLRTTYAAGPDGPVQQVHPRMEVPFLMADAAGWSDEQLKARLREEAFRAFDLEKGPVLRAALFTRGDEAWMVLAIHHIAADFWSLAVLARELGALAGGAVLPPPAVLYSDFARAEQRMLAGPRGDFLWEHWRERLAGAPPLDLPADRPRPPAQSFRGVTGTGRLEPADLTGLQALAAARGATLFMTLLAALQALLARAGGQEDFAVGAPTSGRGADRWSGVVGYFVNPVALRADLAGDPTGEELLARVRQTSLDAFAHQDFPFALLTERLQPERDPGRPPVVQAMLALEKAPGPELAALPAFALGLGGARLVLGGLTLESMPLPTPAAQLDLTLMAAELDGGLALALQLNADLFDEATAVRMLGHFANLLPALTAAPDRRVSDLEILSPAERSQILVEWQGATPDYPRDETIHSLVAGWARTTPQAPAVIMGDRALTYAALDARAGRLARFLRAQGVELETPVGIALERSPELVVSFLGILKAGGVCVPLDPAYPRERLLALTDEVPVPVVITEERLLAGLPAFPGSRFLCIDRIEREIALDDGIWVDDLALGPRALAHLMFTSGSTGRPKAVGIEHRGIVRLLRNTDWGELGPDLVFLNIAPASFDATTLEIWAPLLNGGHTVLFPGRSPSMAELGEALERYRVTMMWITAGFFHQIVESRVEILRPLRQVMSGGDVLSAEAVNRVLAELPDCRILNGYGPTENCTFTSVHFIRKPLPAGEAVPIGRVIANTRAYVVDRTCRPVPSGVPGELLCGGDGLARGYLNRADLTAEKWVPDAVSGAAGARLYRSGDLVRWRPDGVLEFLGRIDRQVKIRGFRVEPGEIEVALSGHPAVRDAAVLVTGGGAGDKRLVAYVAADADPGLIPSLRAFLRERLPDAMVPSAFVVLPELPLNANHKIDRGALPAPDRGATPEEERLTPPRTPVEELVAGVWAEVLGVERIGVHDDFFARGGHSLLATQVLARLREPFGVEPPLAAFFADPTVAGLATAVEAARRGQTGGKQDPPLVAVPRDGRPLPLTFAQERLWFLDRLHPGLPVYNIPAGLRLRGPLGAAGKSALADAFTAIVGRHEALRTAFAAEADGPAQSVVPASPVPLPEVDLAGLPDPEGAARQAAAQAARAPFALDSGRLLRTLLLRLGGEEHQLLLSVHHIAADGWSLRILLGELEALFAAGLQGRAAELPGLPVQVPDYAVWQRALATAEALAAPLAAWRQDLAGAPGALDLSTDRPRRPAQSFRGAVLPFTLSADTTSGLRDLARREGATLSMALLAGFALLLARHSGQEDIVVGSPVANRSRPQLEGLIGFFVNTLPLRVRLDRDPSFRTLLGRAREAALAAWSRQEVPFERLVEELQPQRDLARSPLFQVMLSLEESPIPALHLAGLAAEAAAIHTGTAKFELTLHLSPSDQGLGGEIEFDADLFDAATPERLLSHLAAVLETAAAEPGRPALELPLLPAAEALQILAEGESEAFAGEPGRGLHELFSDQAASTPEAAALLWGTERISYRDLDRRAERLARRLRTLGVGPEVLVGVFSGRTPGLIAALLGILKAGGAYVPLDPAYPAERVAFLLADSGAPVVLAEERLLPSLPSHGGRTVVIEGPEDVEDAAAELPRGWIHPDQLAYVIYTSGSTGVPKGVGIRHSSAVAMASWALRAYRADRLAGVLAATSVCFDLSVFEIFVPLAAGGAVVLADDALALPDLPAAGEVTLVNTVPSAMSALVHAGGLPASVRVVNLAGEPLRRELASRLYALPGIEEVWNLYGPSEDTTYSTGVLVPRGCRGEPTVGRPLPGGRAWVLDSRGQPAPRGVPGELWLGGEGLARGYLGRPELTADRFRPDALSGLESARLYRTGDLARRRSDGEIEFLGRLDQQVKVRGFRVEPGEVEAALGLHPAVAEAVVVSRSDVEGNAFLAAYVVPASPEAGGGEVLRKWLRERLPGPFVPSAWVFLDALPRTPNGKVDRKRLPSVEPAGDRPAATAPRTPAEELLAGLFAEALGRETIGVEDDFFALGGHSLLAARVAARLREPFGVELPVRALFEAPTVAALAARLETARREGRPAPPPLVPRSRTGRREASPLSFAQERLWFLDRLTPGSPVYNLPAALRLRGPLDAGILQEALGEIVRRHEALRTVFAMAGGRPVQVIQPPALIPLPVFDLGGHPEPELAARAAAEAEVRRPFDLESGPVLRALLLRLAPADHLLVLTVHHIAADGWSLAILFREIEALYAARATCRPGPFGPSPLAGLGVQYADYAEWQREWLGGGVLAAQLAWWQQSLAGLPATLDLPADRPRPPAQTLRGVAVPFALGAEATLALRGLARRESATLFMVLLAGFAALLARTADEEDLAVGTPLAGRTCPEIEGLIGFFVNTLPLRVRVDGEIRFRSLLVQARNTALDAYSHQDAPFEKLVEALQTRRDLGRSPLFAVMLTLQEMPAPAPRLAGLEATAVPLHTGTTRCDLTLSLAVEDGTLAGGLELDSDLFDAATGERLLGHLASLLAAAAANPGLAASELPLLAEAELRQLVLDDNATAVPFPRGRGLYDLFAAQAARTPEAPAVVWGRQRLSYREIDRRADALARRLLALGAGAETLVGIFSSRTPDMIAALLAVLKAGAAYLPLDPAYPPERLAFLLADSGAPVVLAEARLAPVLPPSAAHLVLLDEAAEEGEAGLPGAPVHPEQLAYAIYTSGSTGRPKAVLIRHAGAAARIAWALAAYPAERLAGVLAATSICFDLSVFEIFVPLAAGGTVILADDALALPGLPAAGEVTLVNTVPSAISALLQSRGLPSSVRTVNLAGEPLRHDLAARLYAQPGVAEVWNLYGPSEDTTYSTGVLLPREMRGEPTIGRPLSNSRALVLDASGQPSPSGTPGELWLGGEGLARGYLGRPELTADRFRPDPFATLAGLPGARLYRTGDRARRRPDGEIEFLGRRDHQVKVRGFRIELGEIEAALACHPGVGEAAVAKDGEEGLLAWVVPAVEPPGGGALAGSDLRAFLAARMPAFMIPGVFLTLPALPRTPNGKVDRNALAQQAADGRPVTTASYEPPSNPVEELLAGLWSEVLEGRRIGIHDDFFALGGHSLLGVRLLSRVRDTFGVELPVRTLFTAPTVAGLADLVAGEMAARAGEELLDQVLAEAPQR